MSQCVSNWELQDLPNSSHGLPINPSSSAVTVAAAIGSRSDYEVAELTWVNGRPSMHGLGQLRTGKPEPEYPSPASWDKVLAGGGTLESVVDQPTGAILFPQSPTTPVDCDLVPWIPPNTRRGFPSGGTASVSAAVLLDAVMPCSKRRVLVDDHSTCFPEPPVGGAVGAGLGRKRGRDGNCRVSGDAASMALPFDTCHINGGGGDVGFTTSTSPLDGSPDTQNTSCRRADTTVDEHDWASQSRRSLGNEGCLGDEKRKTGEVVRSSIPTKRSRVAAVHNQSERKRRDRINQKLETLQKLVPNSSKRDKASMLDEVIDYIKQLQAQVQTMKRMSTLPHMTMPMPMQVQLQMAMMAQMARMARMGILETAVGVDMVPLARPPTQSTGSLAQPMTQQSSTSFPFVGPSRDTGRDPVQPLTVPTVLSTISPFSAFRTCQAQLMPTNMDTFNRMPEW